jgi:hypothetical protein
MAASPLFECPGHISEATSISLFECRCEQRKWHCYTLSQSAGTNGGRCFEDGGPAAAGDAGQFPSE